MGRSRLQVEGSKLDLISCPALYSLMGSIRNHLRVRRALIFCLQSFRQWPRQCLVETRCCWLQALFHAEHQCRPPLLSSLSNLLRNMLAFTR